LTAARLFTASSGWTLVLLLALTVSLPYSIRSATARRGLGALRFPRLRLHFWIGYGIVALTLVHSWVPMRPDIAGRANRQGLLLASAASGLLLVQLVVGLLLTRPGSHRAALLRLHFWMMLVLLGLTAGHVVLNAS
jgi:hypothetical protein